MKKLVTKIRTKIDSFKTQYSATLTSIDTKNSYNTQEFYNSYLGCTDIWFVSLLADDNQDTNVVEMNIDALLMNPSNVTTHSQERVEEASLEYPIMVLDTGVIVDGRHRLANAKRLGKTTIKAKVITLPAAHVKMIGTAVMHNDPVAVKRVRSKCKRTKYSTIINDITSYIK